MHNDNKNSQNWLLIADGKPLSAAQLSMLAAQRQVMVLDGAYPYIKQAGLTVNVLLGDFDSISSDALIEANAEHVTIVHAPDQNQTDLQKGIAYLDQLAAKDICIVAATGRRLQHTLYNVRLLKKCYRADRSLYLYTGSEVVRYVQDSELGIDGEIDDSIGILGFPQAVATTSGLKYEISNYPLNFEQSSSVLNTLVKQQATIQIQGAALVIHETQFLPLRRPGRMPGSRP